MRWAAWQYPEGIRPIAKYWPTAAAVQVASVFSADSFEDVVGVAVEVLVGPVAAQARRQHPS
jgi:hypothetical protein